MPVKASAIHYGMCYRYQLKKKLNLFKLTPFMVNSVLAEGKGGFIRAKLVCKTLENFFASADEELTIDHVPIWCKNSQGQRVMVEQSEKLVSLQCVQNEEYGILFVIFVMAKRMPVMTAGNHVASFPVGSTHRHPLSCHSSPTGFLILCFRECEGLCDPG